MARRLTVGEASRALGMSRTTLLAAEESGLLVPIRTPGGHRRYEPAELDRFLARHRVARHRPAPVAASGGPPAQAGPAVSAAHIGPAVRSVVRSLARAMDANITGLYLDEGSGLRFCAAFGIPRWLTERLGESAAPPILDRAYTSGRHRVFDAAEVAFPEPRTTGHGVAVPVGRDGSGPPDGMSGALFVVSHAPRGLLPADLRIVEAFGVLVAGVVADRLRIADLELRLARIAELSKVDATG